MWLEVIGPLSGVLALTVAVLGAFLQHRGQSHVETTDVERLGHADLVAALEMYRVRVPELQAEITALRREVAEWKTRQETTQSKLTDLLFLLETRRDQ